MGRMRVVWIVNLEVQGGSPCICQLSSVLVESEQAFDFVLTHMGHMKSPN
jgi:hypothetical protein